MKILFILFAFLQTFVLPSFAQLISRKDSADYTVKTYALADTIHVRGKLSTPDGEPAKGLLVWVQSQKYDYFDSVPTNFEMDATLYFAMEERVEK